MNLQFSDVRYACHDIKVQFVIYHFSLSIKMRIDQTDGTFAGLSKARCRHSLCSFGIDTFPKLRLSQINLCATRLFDFRRQFRGILAVRSIFDWSQPDEPSPRDVRHGLEMGTSHFMMIYSEYPFGTGSIFSIIRSDPDFPWPSPPLTFRYGCTARCETSVGRLLRRT
jgi:hypothetical protein